MSPNYATVKRCLETVSKHDVIKNAELVKALSYLLSEEFDETSALLHGRTIYGSIEFRVGTTAFQLRYPPIIPKIIIRYRHMEGCTWKLAKFKETDDVVKEILNICRKYAVESPPGPFSI